VYDELSSERPADEADLRQYEEVSSEGPGSEGELTADELVAP
jgi:hypothetical protein